MTNSKLHYQGKLEGHGNMAKLFLHIGPHKTGSTYIQKFFFDKQDHLLNIGVNYPNMGFGGQYGHHEAVEKVRTLDQEALEAYLRQFLCSDINFVSSENFDRLNRRDVEKLGKSLSKLDVRVIYYYSWWQEEVKHGSVLSFYEFVLPHTLRPFSSVIINPAVVLDLYADVFGKNNITIVNYDRAVQSGSILHPIFELLGLEFEAPRNEFVNSSLKVEFVEIIRALNNLAHVYNQWNSHKTRALFLRKRTAEAICSDVEHLATLIRDQLKPVKLSGGFFEKSVKANLQKKYESCFFNSWPAESLDREVLLPSGNWALTRDALVLCERVYQYIMTGDISY
jgi:hypothetical protein